MMKMYITTMLTTRKKKNIIGDMQAHDKDTGSAQVQIGIITRSINELAEHLKKNPKDQSSRRGLLKMVSMRRKLLKYLSREDEELYKKVLDKLGLKK